MTESKTKLLEYTDVMFDIETLGTNPNAPILSVAAVPFNADSGVILAKEFCFHKAVRLQDELDHGAKPDGSTMLWWLGQEDAARSKLLQGQEHPADPQVVVRALDDFFLDHGIDPATVRVWGNGANFDIMLLERFFERYSYGHPWKFYNVRCFRTLKNLLPSACVWKPEVKHDALEDAYAQALNCVNVLHSLPVVTANV